MSAKNVLTFGSVGIILLYKSMRLQYWNGPHQNRQRKAVEI